MTSERVVGTIVGASGRLTARYQHAFDGHEMQKREGRSESKEAL
jgi:hypothetical protein